MGGPSWDRLAGFQEAVFGNRDQVKLRGLFKGD
jgi:hypothetical protein